MLMSDFGWFMIGALIVFLGFIMWLGKNKTGTALGLGIFGVAVIYAMSSFDRLAIEPAIAVMRGELATLDGYLATGLVLTLCVGILLIIFNYIKYGNVLDTKANQGFGGEKARMRMVVSLVIILTLAIPLGATYYYEDYVADAESGSLIYDLGEGSFVDDVETNLGATASYSWEHTTSSTRYTSDLIPIGDGHEYTAVINNGTIDQPNEDDFVNHTNEYIALFIYDTYTNSGEFVDQGLAFLNMTIDYTEIGGNVSTGGMIWTLCYYYTGGDPNDFYEFDAGTWENTSATLEIDYAFTFEDLQYMKGHPYNYIGVIIEPAETDENFGSDDVFVYDIKLRDSTIDLAQINYNYKLIVCAILVFDWIVFLIATEFIELPSESGGSRKRGSRGKRRKR